MPIIITFCNDSRKCTISIMSARSEKKDLPIAGAAFLLAQLGAHAAQAFAQRVAALDLTPAQAGLLRLLMRSPGSSQRELADLLAMPPSRFVKFADELEERGLIERRLNGDDRRVREVHLTGAGRALMADLRAVAAAHENALCAGLSAGERGQLRELLQRIADEQGLTPGVHPGYRNLR